MTDFGDWDDDDSFDVAPADAEQVAVKLHSIRRARGLEARRWDQLSDAERVVRVAVVAALVAWGRRQGIIR